MRSLIQNLENAELLKAEEIAPVAEAYTATSDPFHHFLEGTAKLGTPDLTAKLAHQYNIPEIDENKCTVLLAPKTFADESWVRFCLDHDVIPLSQHGDAIDIAMSDPFDFDILESIEHRTQKLINRYYCQKSLIEKERAVIAGMLQTPIDTIDTPDPLQGKQLQEDAAGKVQEILDESVHQHASDIHIEPSDGDVHVRLRIDGLLQELMTIPRDLYSQVSCRIKIMSNLDIAEKRLPQDGAIQYSCSGKNVEFRVSTLPGVYGENIVLRLLDSSSLPSNLSDSGLSGDLLMRYESLILKPYGIVLVTGPTGSGKTTTLYSTLSLINKPSTNLITIEDPVEYRREGMHQIQINTKAGMTFANALRSILRQDPDVIMVGEMRDRETAEIAIRAALTGHLVFSTLHTNDCPSSFIRLIDMGIAPYLVSSSILGILAQRLLRRVCTHCKEPHALTKEEEAYLSYQLKQNHLSPTTDLTHFFNGKGCPMCKGRGYRGRLAIFELVTMDSAVSQSILCSGGQDVITEAAMTQGYRPLWADAFDKALRGETSVEEMMRVLS